MANQIAKFKKYVNLLDEVYQNASKTAVLESDATLAQQGANANEIIIPKLDMDGLGDYDRNSGYVNGDVTMTNETVQFNYDRGRKFSVDAMDNEETAGLAFGKLAAEFIRTKVVPEQDAFRFATYAKLAGTKKKRHIERGNRCIDGIADGDRRNGRRGSSERKPPFVHYARPFDCRAECRHEQKPRDFGRIRKHYESAAGKILHRNRPQRRKN